MSNWFRTNNEDDRSLEEREAELWRLWAEALK